MGVYPVLLPHIIIASGLAVGTLLTLFLLPRDEARKDEEIPLLKDSSRTGHNIQGSSEKHNESPGSQFVQKNFKRKPSVTTKSGKTLRCASIASILDVIKSSDVLKVLTIKECWMCCLLYGTYALVDIGFNEMFPVLASTPPHLKGLGMKPSQLGTILMVVSIVLVVIQLTLLPKLNNWLGPRNLLILANLMLTFWMPLLPTVSAITDSTLQWIAIVAIILIIRASTFSGYLAINILIQNSADADLAGSANGLNLAVASLGRLCGPVMSGSIYSWSLKNIVEVFSNDNPLGFPLNQFLTFFILSLCSIGIAVLTTILPKEMNYSKNDDGRGK